MGAVVVDEINEEVRFEDVTVTFPFSTSSDGIVVQKVGTITITGAQGVSNLLIGLSGAGGPPSPPSAVNVTVIAHDAIPADPVVTVLDPGGPGEAADWTLSLEIPQGDPGAAGVFAIADATDLTGTVEVATANYMVKINSAGDGFELAPLRLGDALFPASVSSTASNNSTPRLLASVSVSAGQIPYAWRPVAFASSIVTGASDVRVDLIAYLGDPDAGGKEIGRAYGLACGTAGVDRLVMVPNYPTTAASSDGKVAAGAAASVYLRAVNQGNASANWATSNTSTSFWVAVLPVT